jgi:hypothetical protein
MSRDPKSTPDEKQTSSGDFDRRAFLKILGLAFSTAVLPETFTACTDGGDPLGVDGVQDVEALTARQTIAIVRPEDLLVLTLGLVNLKRTAGQLQKLAPALPAFVIIDFPAQAIVEDAATETTGVVGDLAANAWLGGATRIVFRAPDDSAPIPYALSSILDLCAISSVVVSRPMEGTIATTVPAPAAVDPNAPVRVESRVTSIAAENDPAVSARKMALDGTLAALKPQMAEYQGQPDAAGPPGFSDGSVSKIEIPYRLQLSPNGLAGFSHASSPVKGITGATEVWHTTLGARLAAPTVAARADERNAYLRTARALWTRDTDLVDKTVRWDPPTSRELKNPSLQPSDRGHIVRLSSKERNARPIQINRLMLSSLGGYFDAHAEFDDSNVESWIHKIAGGRETYVEVTQRGVLLPFGNVVTKAHVTRRNDDPTKGPVGLLFSRDVYVVHDPVVSYRPADYKPTTQTKLLQWPFVAVALQQSTFTAQPSSATDGWPVDLSGSPIMIPVVGLDQRGHAIQFSVPLYFVGPGVAPAGRVPDAVVSRYRTSLGAPPRALPRTTDPPILGIRAPKPNDGVTSLNIAMGGQRISYADSTRDDTTFATLALYVDLTSADEKFPYVPTVTGAVLDVEALHAFRSGPVTATFHPQFKTGGLNRATNKSQLLFRLTEAVSADFTNRPDGGTAFIAPNIRFNALSKTSGPAHDFAEGANGVVTKLGELTGDPTMGDGGFHPEKYLNLVADELDKVRIFGVFSLIDIVKAIDPEESAKDIKGLAAEAEQAALKYAPRYVTEALNEIEKILSTIIEVKTQVESIYTNAQELLGNDYVQEILAHPGQVITREVSGVLKTAKGLAVKAKDAVVLRLTKIVRLAKAFYDTLLAVLKHIESFEVMALAKKGPGTIPQLIADGKALKVAIVELAKEGVRATVQAKQWVKDSVDQIPPLPSLPNGIRMRRMLLAAEADSGPHFEVNNAALKIAQGIEDAYSKKFKSLEDIVGKIDDAQDIIDLGKRLKKAFDQAKEALHSLKDLTVKIDWQPKIGSYYVPGTKMLVFRPASQHGLSLAMEARTKAKDGKAAGVDVSCRLEQFDLCLGPVDDELRPLIAMQFDHISFVTAAGKKPDVDVKINGINFGGYLRFLQMFSFLIPLDGFSDPPYLHVDTGGIHAGFTLQIPNIAIGIFSIENIAISAKLEIPFFSDKKSVSALTFTFSFCDKDHPFLITVSMLGGGGYFVVSFTPKGIQSLEASICVGAQIAINLANIAQGSVTITVGITFTVTDMTDTSGKVVGKDILLSAFFRIHGELDVLGVVSVSIDVRLTMSYDIKHNSLVAEGEITIDVSVIFFSVHKSVHVRKEFQSCNNDPTLRQLMPPNELNQSQYWADYCAAYA